MRFHLSLILLLGMALGLLGCDKPTDDRAQIRQICVEAVAMAQKHDSKGLLEFTTADFQAFPGGRSQADVQRVLFVAFRRYGKFTIHHPEFAITLNDANTTATVTVPFLVAREGEVAPEGTDELAADPTGWVDAVTQAVGDPYRLELGFTKKEGDWKIWKAKIDGFKRYDAL